MATAPALPQTPTAAPVPACNVRWINMLGPDAQHPFAHAPRDADASSMAGRYSVGHATVHLHGGHLGWKSDGHPVRRKGFSADHRSRHEFTPHRRPTMPAIPNNEITGEFFEACDCEVVCSCWAGIGPDMGSCTGLFAWRIDQGRFQGENLGNCRVVVVFRGKTCDQADKLLVLIDASSAPQTAALKAAVATSPWADVIRTGAVPQPQKEPRSAQITITSASDSSASITMKAGSAAQVEAFCSFKPISMTSADPQSLIQRAAGSLASPSIMVGQVNTDAATGSGLNILCSTPAASGLHL